jgi:hypothetical protein
MWATLSNRAEVSQCLVKHAEDKGISHLMIPRHSARRISSRAMLVQKAGATFEICRTERMKLVMNANNVSEEISSFVSTAARNEGSV